MFETAIQITAVVLLSFYAAIRLKKELQMMQQNSYRIGRYWRWLRSDLGAVDRITDLLLLGVVFFFWGDLWAEGGVGLVSLYKSVKELRTHYKKPLVFTARAVRLYDVGIVLIALSVVGSWWFAGEVEWGILSAVLLSVFSPLVIVFAVLILMPFEKALNRWYYNDARRMLRMMPDLVVIGVTGSYGKTSTKHYLYRILSEHYNVLMTPGSYNTTLGVIRTIREHLKPYHNVFIVEMGAKQRGDIREICELVHPRIGILTAVGEQHLESFKTIENVQATKFELIDALPPDGTAVLNCDFPYVASRPVENVQRVIRYGIENEKCDYGVKDVHYGHGETAFTVVDATGGELRLTTRLVGSCNLSNILAGVIVARTLGLSDEEIRYGVSQISQVEHRLSVKRTAAGITVIDDAFNSNPHGAKMALDVLATFTGGRRIVVTPGMIELGAKQFDCNHAFGRQIAAVADYVIVVGRYNQEAIVSGLRAEGFDEKNLFTAVDFAAATAKLRETAQAGDTILYENDLPDTFK